VSGPVTTADAAPAGGEPPAAPAPTPELLPSRSTDVGGVTVRRALPKRQRRTIGAWCFVDHMGPAELAAGAALRVGPHPHIGLHTVTWLLGGEVVHRDSLGSEQPIRPGQLNLMTAGRGVAHAEVSTDPAGFADRVHGAQLWVAQPDATRDGDPAFEHHGELPAVGVGGLVARVLVGELAGARSPARTDTPIVGAELRWPAGGGRGAVPLDPSFEHGLVVLDGEVVVGDTAVAPGALAYLGTGRGDVDLRASAAAVALLLGGLPFGDPPLMWWNFVARTRDEVDRAVADWEAGGERFGPVGGGLPRIPAPRPAWWPAR
jgi:quercetin 2,3-dioxygenase